MIEAFSTSPFYKELIDNYRGKRLSDRATLGNVVKLEYGIEAAARELAAANFISSAEYAGLVQNGILVMSIENGVSITAGDETITNSANVPPQNGNEEKILPPAQNFSDDHFYAFGGIRLYIPRNAKYDEALAKGKLSAAYDELKQLAKDCDDNPPA